MIENQGQDAQNVKGQVQPAQNETSHTNDGKINQNIVSPTRNKSVNLNSPSVQSRIKKQGERKERQRDAELHESDTDYDNPNFQLTTNRIPQLKHLPKLTKTKIDFNLDAEERAIIAKADELTREDVWELLDKKRFADLRKRATILSGQMLSQARCPVCTLSPPCKHYQSQDEIVSDAFKLINQPSFQDVLPISTRQNLIQQLKRQSIRNQNVAMTQKLINDDSHLYLENATTLQYDSKSDLLMNTRGGMASMRRLSQLSRHQDSPSQKEFLKRGNGFGGSPTRFDVQTQNNVLKFQQRNPSVVTVRKRGSQGEYMYGGESVQQLSNAPSISEIEQRKAIQEQIASYRELKFQREQERVNLEANLVEQQRQRIKQSSDKRKLYMESQRSKLEAYHQELGKQFAQTKHALAEKNVKIAQQRIQAKRGSNGSASSPIQSPDNNNARNRFNIEKDGIEGEHE